MFGKRPDFLIPSSGPFYFIVSLNVKLIHWCASLYSIAIKSGVALKTHMTDRQGNLQELEWWTCPRMLLSCRAKKPWKPWQPMLSWGASYTEKAGEGCIWEPNLPQSAKTNSWNRNLMTIQIRFWAVIMASQGYLKEVFINSEERFIYNYSRHGLSICKCKQQDDIYHR